MNDDMVTGCLTAIVIGFIFVVILFAGWGIRWSATGEGEHSGYITAIDQNGYIFQNYVIYFKTDNSSSQEDWYCIDRRDADLITKAKAANKSRKQVTVHYHGVRGLGLDLCKGEQITNIE